MARFNGSSLARPGPIQLVSISTTLQFYLPVSTFFFSINLSLIWHSTFNVHHSTFVQDFSCPLPVLAKLSVLVLSIPLVSGQAFGSYPAMLGEALPSVRFAVGWHATLKWGIQHLVDTIFLLCPRRCWHHFFQIWYVRSQHQFAIMVLPFPT